MIRKYKVQHADYYWECSLEIDEDFVIESLSEPEKPYTTKDAIKDMVEFWGDWKYKLRQNGGDYTKTFIKQLAISALYDVIGESHNLLGVLGYFEESEGWFAMDGSNGIKILFVDDFDFYGDDFRIEEVKP